MNKLKKKNLPSSTLLLAASVITLLAALAYGYYEYRNIQTQTADLTLQLSQTKKQLAERTIENEGLEERVEDQDEQVNILAGELQKLTGTVNILEKLQNTDEELLQKYSKVYFLNEHYVPSRLREITQKYVDSKDPEEQIHADVWPYLKRLLEDAEEDGINLRVVSSYRSFNEQTSLKDGYRVIYGTGANAFSADQGYSEHQLGTTVDFSTAERNRTLEGFEHADAYQWLKENGHRYGFVLSYPPGNSYYVFEPWHWRYVGEKLARDLQKDSAYFYDWEQRKIDGYLIDLFE